MKNFVTIECSLHAILADETNKLCDDNVYNSESVLN